MKKILLALLAVLVILVALVLAHPLWIGPVVRTAVAQLAPKYLGVPAHLDGFSLNAYTGRVTLDGLAVDNPPGCREEKFVTLGHLTVGLDMASLFSSVIVIDEISLQDLYVSIMTDEKKSFNFRTVADACSPSEETEVSEAPKAAKPEPATPAEEEKPEQKVIIDLIQVQTALVQWETVKLPLPSFRLTGIGRSAGGVEFEAAWNEIETQFISALGPLAKGLQTVLATGQGSLDAGLKAAIDATKTAVEASKTAAEATKALDDVSKAMKDGTTESADAAVKSVTDAVKSAEGGVKAIKGLFGK